MTHYSTRLTTVTIKLRQQRRDPDSPQPSWLPSPATALLNLVYIWPRPMHATASPLGRDLRDQIDRGRHSQFSCTLRCQESPTGLCATWPPALVASLSAQHMVGNGHSLVREARLVAVDIRNALLRGSFASMHCQSHQALTPVLRPSANDLTSPCSILSDLLVFSAPLPRRLPCGNAHAIVSSSAT